MLFPAREGKRGMLTIYRPLVTPLLAFPHLVSFNKGVGLLFLNEL